MRRSLYRLFYLGVLLGCGLGSLPATAKADALLGSTNKFAVSYAMYAGGFRALDMQLGYDFTPKTYAITMTAKPYGVIGRFLPWAGEHTTNGTISGATLIPARHEKISRWGEDNDRSLFIYTKGILTSLKRSDIENGKEKLETTLPDASFHKNSVDILTGAAQILATVNEGKPCTGKPIIFDGKRRYSLKFTEKGTETLQSSKYNMYSGKAHICEVEMIPLLGYKDKPRGYYKIQEEARAKGQLPRVWLGQLWKNGPYLPVKMMVKSEYGAVLLHAQGTTH